jgi:hypothetical protein
MPNNQPVCRVRVIGATDDATTLLAALDEHARRLFGPNATYHTQTRSADRTGHVCAYLTVTRPSTEKTRR